MVLPPSTGRKTAKKVPPQFAKKQGAKKVPTKSAAAAKKKAKNLPPWLQGGTP